MIREFYRYYGYLAQFGTLVVLNVLDFCFTRPLINMTDAKSEWNPILSKLVQHYGVNAILYWKLSFLALIWVILFLFMPRDASAPSSNFRKNVSKLMGWINLIFAIIVLYGGFLYMRTL